MRIFIALVLILTNIYKLAPAAWAEWTTNIRDDPFDGNTAIAITLSDNAEWSLGFKRWQDDGTINGMLRPINGYIACFAGANERPNLNIEARLDGVNVDDWFIAWSVKNNMIYLTAADSVVQKLRSHKELILRINGCSVSEVMRFDVSGDLDLSFHTN